MFEGRYVSGDEYRRLGATVTSLIIRFDKATARTPRDKAVFFPSYLSLKEIEEFHFVNRGLISPWGTPAGQLILNSLSAPDAPVMTFETFQQIRKDLLTRFARNIDGNLTIAYPRPESEPKAGTLHDLLLPVLAKNPRLATINGEYKEDFISEYRQAVHKERMKKKYHAQNYAAPIHRIK